MIAAVSTEGSVYSDHEDALHDHEDEPATAIDPEPQGTSVGEKGGLSREPSYIENEAEVPATHETATTGPASLREAEGTEKRSSALRDLLPPALHTVSGTSQTIGGQDGIAEQEKHYSASVPQPQGAHSTYTEPGLDYEHGDHDGTSKRAISEKNAGTINGVHDQPYLEGEEEQPSRRSYIGTQQYTHPEEHLGTQDHPQAEYTGEEQYHQQQPHAGFAGVGAVGYPSHQQDGTAPTQVYPTEHHDGSYPEHQQHVPEGHGYSNELLAPTQGEDYKHEANGQPSYAASQKTRQTLDPTSGAVPVESGYADHKEPSVIPNERPATVIGNVPDTGVRPVSTSPSATEFGQQRTIQGGGLAAAIATSGHNLTKQDKKALKSELKNERKFEKQLVKEAKSDQHEIELAMKTSQLSLKKAQKAGRYEAAYRSTYEKAIKAEIKAKKILLRATNEYNKVAADLERHTKEMEIRKNQHLAAQQTRDADNYKVDELRKKKGQNDMEREAKHGSSVTKQNQAKRALSMSSKRKSSIF